MNYQSVRWYALDEKRLTKASDGLRDAWGLIKTQIKVFDSSRVSPDRYHVETFALSLSAAPSAQAFPICKAGYQCIRWYYSDSSYTTLVGSTYRFCDGTTSTTGQITGYVRVENDLCG